VRVVGLFCYPVKSMRGVEAETLELGPRGPAHDREFMVVDEANRFVSQRNAPALATLTARVDGATLALGDDGGAALEVPLDVAGLRRDVTVWRDTVSAIDCGDVAARWLATRLGRSCRLVRFPADSTRPVDPAWRSRADAETRFTDGYPLLVTNTASLAALNERLARPLGMERFRPNVVVEADTPWAEDDWRQLRVGDVVLDLVKPCARCVVITTDQRTGARPDGSAPLATLAAFRTQPPHGAVFGQNAVHAGSGWLRVGAPVEVLARRRA
jgi:uncharacterized protein YcbX